MSKKSSFIVAFSNLPSNTSRKDALVILSAACGLSLAGTSTYYANVKSGKWSTTNEPKPAIVVAPVEVKATEGVSVSTEPESVAIVAGVKIVEDNGLTTVDGTCLNDLTGVELVQFYNDRTTAALVSKFRSKADGIKRIVNMLCE